jgi:rhodanese-related sulfurtransferase
MRTSDSDILAAGDAVETPHLLTGEPVLSMLAGPANREGRIAADTIGGRDSAYRGTQGTAVVQVFDMTAGGTGMTETELRAAGMDHRKVYTHQNGHAAYYPGTAPLFLKVLFDPAEGRLLGAQVLGWDGVDKRIDVLAVALRAGMTIYDLEHLELAYAPPYGSAKDPVNMAGFLGSNLLRGDIDLWYAEDYPACAERVTILDTRTQAEYDAWHIPEAILMPYTELRDRLDEVSRDRPVYTYCRSGLRSYIAYCVLKQNGWDDAAFLAGGMMTFHGSTARRWRSARAGCRWWPTPRTNWPSAPAHSRMSDATVEVVVGAQEGHAEGPHWDAATARLWWVNIVGERVHCLDPESGDVDSWEAAGQPRGPGGAGPRHGHAGPPRSDRAEQARESRQRRQGRRSRTGLGRHDGLRQAAAERRVVPGRRWRGDPRRRGPDDLQRPRVRRRARGCTSPTRRSASSTSSTWTRGPESSPVAGASST